ncbi:ATP-binding cassette domain-containing protein [Lactobacillus kimbladii]|uniref:ATP-binding cassette domain-containing protein n=1 Tax=Lactobacillus kimbladii TaxID=1218506 RepID=UPI0016503455|nr:ATP-binding cassette domain-containing protein [Lactobacillus kimbladii]
MELIKIDYLQIGVAASKLLTVSNLSINSRQKIGLIGNNGAGKTTLMKILAQEKLTDLFTIKGAVINNCNFAYVPQLLDAGDKSGGQREKLALSRAIAKLKKCLTACCFWTSPLLIWILRSNNG